MVALTREAKGMTQAELGEKAGTLRADVKPWSQGFISKVEAGLLPLSGDNLSLVAEALDCPVQLLIDDTPIRGIEVTCVHHRRRHSKMTVGAKRRIEALTHLTRVSVEGLLGGIELIPETGLHRFDLDEYGDPAEVARAVRVAWRVPTGPIASVVGLLESVGVVLVERSLGTTAQDAASTWPPDPGRPPIMIFNAGLAPDRQRSTLSHEAGHLLMHALPGENQEAEADAFAAEFLVPAEEVEPQLAGLTTRDFPRLLELKAHWKVSVAMLIRRAKDLDLISDRQYREFQIKLGKLGWRKNEPGNLPREVPQTVDRVMSVHLQDHEYSLEDLARVARMNVGPFRAHYRPKVADTVKPTALRLVRE